MVQPAVRILSPRAASDAARLLETPAEVAHFEAMAAESPSVRAFMASPEWRAIRTRIAGNGRPPMGRLESLADLARLYRFAADGTFSEDPITSEARLAYLHCAGEAEALVRNANRVAPVSPAPAPPRVIPGSGLVSFGEALTAVRAGAHISRALWSGGAYVTAQAGYPQGIGVNGNTAQATGLAQGEVAVFGPYLLMRMPDTAPVVDDGRFVEQPPRFEHWTPGQSDLFADDWRITPRG